LGKRVTVDAFYCDAGLSTEGSPLCGDDAASSQGIIFAIDQTYGVRSSLVKLHAVAAIDPLQPVEVCKSSHSTLGFSCTAQRGENAWNNPA